MIIPLKRLVVPLAERLMPRTVARLRFERRLRRGSHAEPELALVPWFCDEGRLAIDVGAFDGEYTYAMSKRARTVHAFEPNRACYERLLKRMPTNVVVHACALSDAAAEAVLRVPEGLAVHGTIEPANDFGGAFGRVGEAPVRTEPLDDLGLSDVAFIKIDVEGHELAVLRGGARTIARDLPILQVELEDRHRPNAIAEAVAELAARGYGCFFLSGGRLRPFREFVPERHQNVASLSADRTRRTGLYINNFIFLQKTHEARLGDLLRP